MPGFPIRTSSDQRSVGSSPRHIAASHVLHRLPVPRHPPCALKHLQHKTKKMSHHPHTTPTPERAVHHARVSEKFALQQDHNPHKNPPPRKGVSPMQATVLMLATTIHKSNTTPHHQSRATTRSTTPTGNGQPPTGLQGLLSQSPIVCSAVTEVCCAPDPHPLQA